MMPSAARWSEIPPLTTGCEWRIRASRLRLPFHPLSPTRFRFSRDGAPIPEEDLPLQTVARTLQPIHDYEFDVEFDDGSRRTLIGNAVPLLDEHGQGRGAVAAFIDVTERRRMQDRLREAQRLESVGLLAGGVAHDFNNLLVPILGYAGMVRESLETLEPRPALDCPRSKRRPNARRI